MTRTDFLKRVMRYLLMIFLGLAVLMLGKKIAYGKDCTGCPEIANCPKNFDCKR